MVVEHGSAHDPAMKRAMLSNTVMAVTTIAAAMTTYAWVPGAGAAPTKSTAKKPERLADYLPSFDESSMNRRIREVEQKVATCMKAQGFDYRPIDPGSGAIMIRIDDGTTDPTDLRAKGYGITEMLERMRKVGAEPKDPNGDVRAKLPAAQRKAYDEALMGKEMARAFERARAGKGGTASFVRGRLGGCRGEAEKALSSTMSVMDTLSPKLEEMGRRIRADSRMVEARKQWQACMRKRGYTYTDREAILSDLRKRAGVLVPGGPDAGEGSAAGAASDTRDANVVIGHGSPPVLDPGKLDALRTLERQIATADATCTEPIDKTIRAVMDEHERRFVDEHRAELDKVRG